MLPPEELIGAAGPPARFSLCGVTMRIVPGDRPEVVVTRADGDVERLDGSELDVERSAEIFDRSTRIASVDWIVVQA